MALAEDGPPACPACDRVVSPTWRYCASCGTALADDATLDHTKPADLRRAYEEHDTIAAAAERFDVGYAAVRQALIDHGIHTPRTYHG